MLVKAYHVQKILYVLVKAYRVQKILYVLVNAYHVQKYKEAQPLDFLLWEDMVVLKRTEFLWCER